MNAPSEIEPTDVECSKNVLRVARETALGNAAVHRGTWVGSLAAVIAEAANHMIWSDAPMVALDDAQAAIRHLLRAQKILGHLEGVYPTDRYTKASDNE